MSGAWATVLAHLEDGSEWTQLRGDLDSTAGGGPAAVALASRAMGALRGGIPGAESLVAALQAAAWEKLHLGTWRGVALVWRDAYSLACLLAAVEQLRPGSGDGAALPRDDDGAESGFVGAAAERLGSALRHLDLAALMGGPLLRPLVDAVIADLQAAWRQRLHVESPAAAAAAADSGALPLDDDFVVQRGAPAIALPPGSMGGGAGCLVRALSLPSLERFAAELLPGSAVGSEHGTPAVLDGVLASWPALRRWRSARYLRSVAGGRTVPVELGLNYLAEGWGQGLMLFETFVAEHLLAPRLPSPPHAAPAAAQDAVAGAAPAQQLGYLAQHALLEQVPALGADISTPEYCALGRVRAVNAWLGPGGTTTPLHTDPCHNLLCQVAGRKYVRLYRPDSAPALYPHPSGLATNSSRVDLDAPDPAAFPLFAGEPFAECVLEAGHALYIPPGWWHYVKALTPAFSVSFWWDSDGEGEGSGRGDKRARLEAPTIDL
jgi:lysine-specific demethylase 8